MSEIFDKLVGENEVVRIDKLEINLGNISSQHLDYESAGQRRHRAACSVFFMSIATVNRPTPPGTGVRLGRAGG